MGKTKAEIIDAYEKKLKEGLENIEKATIIFDTREAALNKLINPYTKIILSQLCDDLKLDDNERQAVDKIFNWVRQGKSLEDIKEAEPFKHTDKQGNITSLKKIEDNLQYIFDAATIYKESIDTEKERFRQSFKKMQITGMSDEFIKRIVAAGKLDKKNKNGKRVYPKKTSKKENSISAYDLVQKNANNIVLDSYLPTPENRGYGNFLRNPKLSDAQKFEIAEMSLGNKKTECTQIIINELMNIDIDKYINMSPNDIYHNYDEYQYIYLMIHDPLIIEDTKDFLTEDEQALLKKYVRSLDRIITEKLTTMSLDASNFSKAVDWRNMNVEQCDNMIAAKYSNDEQSIANNYYLGVFNKIESQKDLQELETTKSYLTQVKESLKNRGFTLSSYNKYHDNFQKRQNGQKDRMPDLVQNFTANVSENGQKELYGIFDSKYNELNEAKLEDCLVNGKEVIVAYKGDTKAQLVKVTEPNKVPVEVQKQELSTEQKIGLSFSLFNKAAEAILKDEQLPKDEKMLTGSMLETQYKLAVFVDSQATNPELKKDSQDLAAKLMAKVTILEMLKKTPVEEKEIRKTLISEKNINEFANKLKESGVAEIVATNLNKVTGSGVINLSTKELYKEMVKANKLVSEKDLAKKAPEQKLEGGPEKEVKAVLK